MSPRFRVRWTLVAERDLSEIVHGIFDDDPDQALATLKKMRNKASSLERFPERGRIVPELRAQGVTIYREIIVPPWRMVYRISDSEVRVLALWDSRRNVEDLLLNRFIRP